MKMKGKRLLALLTGILMMMAAYPAPAEEAEAVEPLLEALELPEVECLRARAEEAIEARGAYDVACSRAGARLRLLCELCLPLVKVGGLFLAMKGSDCGEELAEAKHAIDVLGGRLEGVTEYAIPGTEIRHAVVAIRKIADTPARYPRPWAQIKKKPL